MNWNDDDADADVTSGPRACERCGAGAAAMDAMQAAQHAMCRELMMGANRPGWLCYDCRKEWLGVIATDAVVEELILAELDYDIWRSRVSHPAVQTVNMGEGKVKIATLRKAKTRLDMLADEFVRHPL